MKAIDRLVSNEADKYKVRSQLTILKTRRKCLVSSTLLRVGLVLDSVSPFFFDL